MHACRAYFAVNVFSFLNAGERVVCLSAQCFPTAELAVLFLSLLRICILGRRDVRRKKSKNELLHVPLPSYRIYLGANIHQLYDSSTKDKNITIFNNENTSVS